MTLSPDQRAKTIKALKLTAEKLKAAKYAWELKEPNAIAVKVYNIGDEDYDEEDWVVDAHWTGIIRNAQGRVTSESSAGGWSRIPLPSKVRMLTKGDDQMSRAEAIALAKKVIDAAKKAGYDVHSSAVKASVSAGTEDLHTRIAKALGWSMADVRSFSLRALRDLVKAKNPKLAREITLLDRSGGHIKGEVLDGALTKPQRTTLETIKRNTDAAESGKSVYVGVNRGTARRLAAMGLAEIVPHEKLSGKEFQRFKITKKGREALSASISAARGTYVDVKDLPPIVQRALKANGYRGRNIELIPAQKTDLMVTPFEGNRGFNVFIDLAKNKTREEKGSWGGANPYEQKLTDIDQTKRPLPDNVIHIKGESGGRGSFARIYVNQKTMAPMLPAKEDVSADEAKALGLVKSLKGGKYRAEAFQREGLGQYNDKNPIIISLIAKGMLKKNARGAIMITTKGKNNAGRAFSYSAVKAVTLDQDLANAIQTLSPGDKATFSVVRKRIYHDPSSAPPERESKLTVEIRRVLPDGKRFLVKSKKGRRGMLAIQRTAVIIDFAHDNKTPVKYEVMEMLSPQVSGSAVKAAKEPGEKPIARRRSADGKSVLGWKDYQITGAMGYTIRGMPKKLPERAFWATLDDAELYNQRELPTYAREAAKMAKKGNIDFTQLRKKVDEKLQKSPVSAAAGDVTVTSTNAIAPPDDLDDEFATQVEVEFEVRGSTLAQLLGKQQRVLEQTLQGLNDMKVPQLLQKSGPGPKAIKKVLDKPVRDEVAAMAREEFRRKGAKVTSWDWTRRRDYWTADIKRDSVVFRAEVDVEGKWVGAGVGASVQASSPPEVRWTGKYPVDIAAKVASALAGPARKIGDVLVTNVPPGADARRFKDDVKIFVVALYEDDLGYNPTERRYAYVKALKKQRYTVSKKDETTWLVKMRNTMATIDKLMEKVPETLRHRRFEG